MLKQIAIAGSHKRLSQNTNVQDASNILRMKLLIRLFEQN